MLDELERKTHISGSFTHAVNDGEVEGEFSAMKDYRVTVKVRNNRLLKAIEESGGTPGQKWCDANYLSYTKVNELINMTRSPITSYGALSPIATQLCDLLNKVPEDLWSAEQLHPLEKNFAEMEMSHEQLAALLPSEQQSYELDISEFENKQVAQQLLDVCTEALTPRERQVLHYRFTEDMSHVEIGKILGVCRDRIIQIEAKVLRKLRSGTRLKKLSPLLAAYAA
ncbi:MAG: RNA polymerase subunit sigma-70 [Chloracidobacterium sp.]|nr:RNA polymerase subunit sigma-70 [Chloracidobacterium sp.]